MKTEFDTSAIAWETYKYLYDNSDFTECKNANRESIKGKLKYADSETKETIAYSGETDFNFGPGWSNSIFNKYKKLINTISVGNEEEKNKYKVLYHNNLKICQILYKSVVNVSLMPQSGNLQLTKKGIGNDRIDTFIWGLDAYYDKDNPVNIIANNSTWQHMELLLDYLNLFGNVYDYCKGVYHINESLVDDMIESGKKAIDSPDRVIEYMNLALRFWRQKLMYLNSCTNISPDMELELKKISTIMDLVY